jgi:retron-type reverse transcriptase
MVFEGKRENSDVGTPQGGVISPLLANIALHGMENRITQLANSLKGDKSKNRTSLTLLDHLIWQRLKRWCERRHPKKSVTWVLKKYFKSVGDRNWVFGDKESTLLTYSETPIIRWKKLG